MLLFALLLPALAAVRGRSMGDETPLLVMLVFPLSFYPLIQVEPRFFYPILMPVHVFGAAGLVAFGVFASSQFRGRHICAIVLGATLTLMCAISVWRGINLERDYRIHRELARWLEQNTSQDDRLVGCGYGHITTTAFLADRTGIPRLWTDKPGDLLSFARDRGVRWLLIYEPFLRKANPELLPALESGFPGFRRVFEVRDWRGQRCQVYLIAAKIARGTPNPAPNPALDHLLLPLTCPTCNKSRTGRSEESRIRSGIKSRIKSYLSGDEVYLCTDVPPIQSAGILPHDAPVRAEPCGFVVRSLPSRVWRGCRAVSSPSLL